MMDESLRFAAVDIGSNAVRLLFCYVFETKYGPVFQKASLIRVPIRLGKYSFHNRPIPEKRIKRLCEAMTAFKALNKAFKVIDYKACATSAMRDAVNGKEVIQRVKEHSGIEIQLIEGEIEAELIFGDHIAERLSKHKSFIYMDVGGGSTEFTVYENGSRKRTRSFNIGTIRLKDNLVEEDVWNNMHEWLIAVKNDFQPETLIGSGGNINTLFKLSQLRDMQPMSKALIKSQLEKLKSLSYDEKIAKLGMRPDRADVVIPATELFLTALNKSGCKDVIVPKVGLADGIVHQLYRDYKAKN